MNREHPGDAPGSIQYVGLHRGAGTLAGGNFFFFKFFLDFAFFDFLLTSAGREFQWIPGFTERKDKRAKLEYGMKGGGLSKS